MNVWVVIVKELANETMSVTIFLAFVAGRIVGVGFEIGFGGRAGEEWSNVGDANYLRDDRCGVGILWNTV
jgi:hypothetical protein